MKKTGNKCFRDAGAKRALVWLIALMAWLFLFPVTVRGSTAPEEGTDETDYLEKWLGELDFTELDELLAEEIFPVPEKKMKFSDVVEAFLADGIMEFDYSSLLKWAGDALFYEFGTNREIIVGVIFLAVGFAVLQNFSGVFKSAYISEICFLMVYCILSVLLLRSFTMYSEIVAGVLEKSVDFMKALVPVFSVSMIFSAGAAASAGFYQLAFLVIYLIQWLFLNILLPAIHIYVIVELFNHFFPDEKFQNLTELLKGFVNWGMKSAGILVLGLNVVQGIVAPAKDRLFEGMMNRAAAIVPGIGNVLNGIGELMLGAGILIKNCVGAAALVLLVLLALMPVLKILAMSVLYKVAAVVVEPVADKRITGCIRGLAEGGILYLRLVLYCIALFFVTIALTTAMSGGIV